MSKNIILTDFKGKINSDFIKSLSEETGIEWEEAKSVSNGARTNKFYNIVRYAKYLIFSFKIFLNRKKYDNILAWQQFYGLIYAFYCRLFHSKKYNKLIVMTFIYKDKKGLAGILYKKFINYILNSKYIDSFICFSREECEYYSSLFNLPKDKFKYCLVGMQEDNPIIENKNNDEKIILSCGRSNRDYDFLYKVIKDTEYKLNIISDECNLQDCKNIKIYRNVFEEDYLKMLSDSYIVVIPLEDENISSGQLAMLQSMQYGKPVISTESNTIKDYIKNGENGYIIKKDKKSLLDMIEKLFNDEELYNKISKNEQKFFNENCSAKAFGKNIGKIFNSTTKHL